MARIAPTFLVVVLLAATAAAFAVTEELKLAPTPIFDTRIENKVISPVCGCETRQARVGFQLREADTVTVSIVDEDRDVVRTLVESESPRGRFQVWWDGRDDAGEAVAEGSYEPRVHLADERWTIVLPNPIRVDVTPPRVLGLRVEPRAFSPDRDGRNDKIKAFYRMSEPAHGLLFVEDERRVRSKFERREDKVDWYGRVGGRALRAGRYAVTMAGEDTAGNVGEPTAPVVVRIRYVELARRVIRVPTAARFGVRVRTDAAAIRWRFAGGTGRAAPGLLELRAPRNPGRYTLFVEANGHGARARVVVEPRRGG